VDSPIFPPWDRGICTCSGVEEGKVTLLTPFRQAVETILLTGSAIDRGSIAPVAAPTTPSGQTFFFFSYPKVLLAVIFELYITIGVKGDSLQASILQAKYHNYLICPCNSAASQNLDLCF